MAFRTGALTPASAIERLKANDKTLITCDLSKNAVLQMKPAELMPQLADALAVNTVCQALVLVGCSIDDTACEHLAKARIARPPPARCVHPHELRP